MTSCNLAGPMTIHLYGGLFSSPQYWKRSSLKKPMTLQAKCEKDQSPEVDWEVVILKQFSLPGMLCIIVVENVEGAVIPGKH